MALYLDTEFNGFHGELISLALASTTGHHWYRTLPLPQNVHPWVAEHVVPFLCEPPDTPEVFRESLWQYLRKHAGEPIYADWPEDFAHLMNRLCEPNGIAPKLELDMYLIQSGDIEPEIPHNALSDAIALMYWHAGARSLSGNEAMA